MTKEEEKLFITDLCARLPYKVRLNFHSKATNEDITCTLLGIYPENMEPIIAVTDMGSFTFPRDHIKPYLCSVERLSDDEVEQLNELWMHDAAEALEFVYSRHIDFRNLIGKGLALPAPAGMYEFE